MIPVAFAGLILAVIDDRPHAPGAPIRATLTLADGPLAIAGKSIGSKRRDDGSFDVRMRLINLRREDRARLERALGTTDRSDTPD
jgi:hypothetical protein